MATTAAASGQVDEEDPAPGPDGEQVAADEGAGRRRDAAQARPGADGAGAVLGAERGLQDGEAGRGEEGPAHTLDDPCHDEQPGARGHAAAGRRHGEPDDPDGEDALAAVAVAEGPPEEEEGGQRQRVAGDDPLQRADAPVEFPADGGERDADDGRIEKGDAGAEDGGGDHPAPPSAREGERLGGCARWRWAAAGVRPAAHWGQKCIVILTTAPGRSTVPTAGSWLSTVCGVLTVVVVTDAVVVVVDDEVVVVVVLPTE